MVRLNLDKKSLILISLIFLMGFSQVASINLLGKGDFKRPLLHFLVFLTSLVLANFLAGLNPKKILKNKTLLLLLLLTSYTLLFVLLIKKGENKVSRWLFGGSFQVSEFSKFVLILLSGYILERQRLNPKLLILLCFIFLTHSFLIYQQPDVGTSLHVLIIFLMALFLRLGLRRGFLAFFLTLFIPLGVTFVLFKGYAKRRLETFLNKKPYQVEIARLCIVRGGMLGEGIGKGLYSKNYLFAGDNDFIYASLGEEMGVFSLFIVQSLYLLLALRIAKVGRGLTSYLIALNFLLSSTLSLGINLGLLPPKGMVSPFLSYGSTNLLFSTLLLAVAKLEGSYKASTTPNPIPPKTGR